MEEETRQRIQIVEQFIYSIQIQIQSTKSQTKRGNGVLTFDVLSFDTRKNRLLFTC